uniref:Pancreatic trypsin inhibitor n=1 Tax=Rhipicephalus zambeziensis TaxID=60191 RepID=A0A224YD40_9ACAR
MATFTHLLSDEESTNKECRWRQNIDRVKKQTKKRQHQLCRERPKQGRCKASFTKVYWDELKGCREYHGCYRGGFLSIRECIKTCGDTNVRWKPRPREKERGRHTATGDGKTDITM